MENESKTATKSENFAKRADELQAQVKAFRAKARAAKRREQAEAKRKEKERLQREAVKLLGFAKELSIEENGREMSAYDYIVAQYHKAERAKKARRKAGSAMEGQTLPVAMSINGTGYGKGL